MTAAGFDIFVGSRDAGRATNTVSDVEKEGATAAVVVLDVSDLVSVSDAFTRISRDHSALHVVVNNAGTDYDTDQTAVEADITMVRRTMDTNVFGAWLVSQKALPLLRAASGPRMIVNVSSGAGQLSMMRAGQPGYFVSKAALNAFTRILAAELEPDVIKVNAICRGWVVTDMGGGGRRSIALGAASVVWGALMDDDGPTGSLFRDGERLDW